MIRSLLVTAVVLRATATFAQKICEAEEAPLFMCETNRAGKYIGICAVEETPGKTWSAVQYRYGDPENAELVFPPDGADGARRLYFSHVVRGGHMYHVSVRFRSAGFTYRVYSDGDSASDPPGDGRAGVTVTTAAGKTIADIKCIERPTLFAPYLHDLLACDRENPDGVAACAASAPHRRR